MPERFELLERLGQGAMGVVWRARDNDSGEVLALKLMHEFYVQDEEYVARIEREVEIARRIESPHVVQVDGYGRRDGIPYIAMEWVDGESLRKVLDERRQLPLPEAMRILGDVAEGLAAVHAAGVIHRDIKPANILIARDGTVKIADFGIARATDLTQLTATAGMLGTPAYMPPNRITTEQSDLYSLGCVFYEMLAGSPPFAGASHTEVMIRHLSEPPDLSKLLPEARPLAGWLLAKAPGRRARSAECGVRSAAKVAEAARNGMPRRLTAR